MKPLQNKMIIQLRFTNRTVTVRKEGKESMKAKEYLKQIEKLDKCIDQKQIECDALRLMAEGTGGMQYGDKVQTSPKGDTLEKKVVKYVQIEQEINDMIDNFIDLKHKIITEIQGLSDVKHIDVLFKKYVEYKSLEQIAVDMHYSYQYIRELHGHALQEFEKTYTNLQ